MGGTMRSVGGTQNAQFLGRRYLKLLPLCPQIPPATQANKVLGNKIRYVFASTTTKLKKHANPCFLLVGLA